MDKTLFLNSAKIWTAHYLMRFLRGKSPVQSRCYIHEGLNSFFQINSACFPNSHSVPPTPLGQGITSTSWPHSDIAKLVVLLKSVASQHHHHHLPCWLNKAGLVINISLKCGTCFLKLLSIRHWKKLEMLKTLCLVLFSLSLWFLVLSAMICRLDPSIHVKQNHLGRWAIALQFYDGNSVAQRCL